VSALIIACFDIQQKTCKQICSAFRYSKEPLFVTKPLSTEAIEGDTVIIFCEVVGDPKPEIIWLRDFLKVNYNEYFPSFVTYFIRNFLLFLNTNPMCFFF